MTSTEAICTFCKSSVGEGTGELLRCGYCAGGPRFHRQCMPDGSIACPHCETEMDEVPNTDWGSDTWHNLHPHVPLAPPPGEQIAEETVVPSESGYEADSDDGSSGRTAEASWKSALFRFLDEPPTPNAWEYAGYQNGGHELRWSGIKSELFGPGPVQVCFHMHFTGRNDDQGRPQWTYGSAWITNVKHMDIRIEDEAELSTSLWGAIRHFWFEMDRVERERLAQPWRKE